MMLTTLFFRTRFAAPSLLAGILLLGMSGAASAQTVTSINGWSEAGFTQNWVSEGRIGDRGGAATFESDLGATTSAPASQAQLGWVSGQDYTFTLSYSGGTANWNIAGQTPSVLTYAVPMAAQNFSDLFIRVFARNANSTMSISSLVLNGSALTGASVSQTGSATPPVNGNALRISNANVQNGFTLTGTARMTWSGAAPTQSALAFQIKAGTQAANAVPEPGTFALLASALPLLGIARRRKK